MAPPNTPDASKSRSGRGGLMLRLLAMILGAAVLLAAGFGAGWFYFAKTASPMSEALRLIDRAEPAATAHGEEGAEGGPPQKVPRPVPETESFVTTYYPMKEALMTNLAGSRRFLQVGVTLSTQYDAKVVANVATHEAAIRSDMLAVIGGFAEDQVAGLPGREALAAALRDAVNARLEALEGFGGIDGVFFTSFVLQ